MNSIIYPSRARKEAGQFIAGVTGWWPSIHVLEIGMLRSRHAGETDGHSTLFWRSLIGEREYSSLTSVDLNEQCISETKVVFVENKLSLHNVFLVIADAEEFLKQVNSVVRYNIIYLDGLDYTDRMASENWHLRCFDAATHLLLPGGLLVVDDNFSRETHEGKGRLVLMEALRTGYKLLHESYQLVLERQ